MMNLTIRQNEIDFFTVIRKENSVIVLNKKSLLKFYFLFYELLKNKRKDITIKIGEKTLDSKNAILLSFCDYTELLDNLNFKKGSLFYEYIISLIGSSNNLDNDILFYDLVNIIRNLSANANIKFSYDINEDLEKMIFNCVDFYIKYDIEKITEIISNLLKNYMEKNISKTFIVFYDSDLLNLDVSTIDSCYTFDISDKQNISEYNLIALEEVKEFRVEELLEKIELMWPVEFEKEKVKENIYKYFMFIKMNIQLTASNEHELITYHLLNKIQSLKLEIKINNFIIRDNVKSFLEQI